MVKRSVQQEDITTVNMHAPNKRAPKFMKQRLTELKRKMDNSTTIAGDFNTSLYIVNTTITQTISKGIGELNSTLNYETSRTSTGHSANSRTHTLLKCMRDILQDRPHVRL